MVRGLLFLLALWPALALAVDCAPEALQGELLRRNQADQAARQALTADPASAASLERALRIDRENTAYMRGVVAACGWPRRSAVGARAAKAAWRLTQHADMDPQYQVLAAQQLAHAVAAGEADAWDLAVLVDRNRRLTHHPQVYGMQFATTPGGTIRFHDIVAPGQLDQRRREIGLVPFFCWALDVHRRNGNASIEWPAGVLVAPQDCTP